MGGLHKKREPVLDSFLKQLTHPPTSSYLGFYCRPSFPPHSKDHFTHSPTHPPTLYTHSTSFEPLETFSSTSQAHAYNSTTNPPTLPYRAPRLLPSSGPTTFKNGCLVLLPVGTASRLPSAARFLGKSFSHPPTHPPTPPSYSAARSLGKSTTHSPTHPLTHPPTHIQKWVPGVARSLGR